MADYVVGDIQGCFDSLQALLESVQFTPGQDRLYAVGDLVNRGPKSLETLRFCYSLGDNFATVLGNHDLHLLAVAAGARKANRKDTLSEILQAHDRDELLAWLSRQPLLLQLNNFTLVHAGIPPQWTLADAHARAREVENALRDKASARVFFDTMYGNTPDAWSDDLQGTDRLRCITNFFTRMRYCDDNGVLNLDNKLPPDQGPAGYFPWFSIPHRKTRADKILFGHWASLQGEVHGNNLVALDTGCIWGGSLTMLRLDNEELISQPCTEPTTKKAG